MGLILKGTIPRVAPFCMNGNKHHIIQITNNRVLENVVSVGTLISIEKNKPFIRNRPNAFQKNTNQNFAKVNQYPRQFNSSPRKNGWKTTLLLGRVIFRNFSGEAASFRRVNISTTLQGRKRWRWWSLVQSRRFGKKPRQRCPFQPRPAFSAPSWQGASERKKNST